MTTLDVPRPQARIRAPRLPLRARARTSSGALLLAAWMLAGCSSDDPLMSTAKPWRTHYTGFEVHVHHGQAGPAGGTPIEVRILDRFLGVPVRTQSGVTDQLGRFRRTSLWIQNPIGGWGGYHAAVEILVEPAPGSAGETVMVLDSLWVVDTPGEVVVSIFEVTLP